MEISPTKEFNKISLIPLTQLTGAQLAILMTMALNGDSIVNPLSNALDRDGLTPEGRARKEREEEKRFFEAMMSQLEERRVEFQLELDRMEQASIEALRENEEQLHEAREDLRDVQERAYQIHMPDGTVERVYRDGDKVRTEAGAEVGREIVKAEDLGDGHSTWTDYSHGRERVGALQAKHDEIVAYRETLHETENKAKSGHLSGAEIEAANRQLSETMPDAVRGHYDQRSGPGDNFGLKDSGAKEGAGLSAPFARAASGTAANHVLSDKDFEITQPPAPASVPSPG